MARLPYLDQADLKPEHQDLLNRPIALNRIMAHGPEGMRAFNALAGYIRRKSKLKGRQPDDQSLLEVRECIGPRPAEGYRRDLLIEHLHRLNDRFGALREPHLVALARETNVPMAERPCLPRMRSPSSSR